MRKTKQEKGITLIALIITIVVLLILAVVAIDSIQDDGIMSHAKNTANTYNQAVNNEQQTLQNYLNYLDKVTTASWKQNGTKVTNGKVTLEVGTTVTGYTSPTGTTDPGWAVLGAENGKLLLVSKTNVQSSVSLNGATHLKDADNNGKVDGIDALDLICKNYLNTDLAESARSITVEDINRVTGYNPMDTGDGNPVGNGYVSQYGNEITYTMNADGYVVYTSDVATKTTTATSFKMPNGTILTKDMSDGIKVTSNYYSYNPTDLQDTKMYNILFNDYYWLASPFFNPIGWGGDTITMRIFVYD